VLRRSFTRPAIHAPRCIFQGPATAVPDRSGVERSQDGDCSALIWYITEDLLPKSLAITSIDSDFSGSIPEVYDSYLVPILFEGYAYDLADRVASSDPTAGLDVSAGSGAVPRALAPRLNGGCCYVVTDINPAMLECARQRHSDDRLEWREANAMSLPFKDESFDVVLCQFGVMFFPDHIKEFPRSSGFFGRAGASSSTDGVHSKRTISRLSPSKR